MSNTTTLSEIRFQISIKKIELSSINSQIEAFELDPDDFADQYNESLTESYGDTVNIAGCEYDTVNALKQLDPTAYRCGLNDYVSMLDNTESEEYRDLLSERDDLECEIEDLEAQEQDFLD